MNEYIQFFIKNPVSSLAVFITIVPIVIIWFRRAFIDKAIRFLFIYLLIKLVIDTVMLQYVLNNLNNLIFYNIHIPIRYILLGGMLYYYFESVVYKRLIISTMAVFLVFSIWDILSVNPDLSDTYNHLLVRYSSTVESVLMIFWLLAFYFDAIQSLRITNLLTFPFFWICGGLLLFYSTYVFIAPLLHYVVKWENQFDIGILYQVPYVFEIISMVLIGLGITYYSPRQYDRS
jgi:hypothetical protein